MWPFKRKKEEIEEQQSVEDHYKNVAVRVFEGEQNPWRIVCSEYKEGYYFIQVFRLDESKWSNIKYCSEEVIGVKYIEYRRLMRELFGFDENDDDLEFNSKELAQKIIDEFAPYYDSFHVPRAIMNRMTFYQEGGYPPYFVKYNKEQGPAYPKSKEE